MLYEPRGPFDYVYFPETAIISNLAPLKTDKTAETSTTGREGIINVGAIMGDDQSMHRAVVQVSGDSIRISFRDFQELQARLPVFRRKLNAYSRAFLAQVMQSVACNASHTLLQRCARWLLKSHDRVDGDELHLTQQFLAEMLVVSRVAVNAELRKFQQLQVLTYSRGIVTILDRSFWSAHPANAIARFDANTTDCCLAPSRNKMPLCKLVGYTVADYISTQKIPISAKEQCTDG